MSGGGQAAVPRSPARPGDRTCSCSRSGRSSTGCRPSRSRGGTCRRWGCPGTARCRPAARWAPRPCCPGAAERGGGRRARGSWDLPSPSSRPERAAPTSGPLSVKAGLQEDPPPPTPGCVGCGPAPGPGGAIHSSGVDTAALSEPSPCLRLGREPPSLPQVLPGYVAFAPDAPSWDPLSQSRTF